MPSSTHADRPLRAALVSFAHPDYCLNLANALAETISVALVVPDDLLEQIRDALSPEVETVGFDLPRLRQPLRQLRNCSELVHRIRALAPDVVHMQQGHLWFNLALGFLGCPLVLTIHDHSHHPGDRPSARTPSWALRIGFRRADSIIVHANVLRDELYELGRVARSAPVHVVPHPELVSPPDAPTCQTEPETVLFFGRIWPYKGLEYLIRAEPLIAEHAPDLRIVIAGKGEDLGRYRKLMAHPERFEIHNEYVSEELRNELFERAAIVVLPYIEASQSGVVPVAYAFAKPTVVTDVGGLPEIVDHDETGLVVPPRDERALAAAVVELLADDERRRRLGQAGRAKLSSELSADAVARQTLRVYESTLDTGRAEAA